MRKVDSVQVLALAISMLVFSVPSTADMELVLLGTGTPNPVPERAGAATAVIVDGQVWIIDAGPGVVRRAAAAHRNGIEALAQPNLSRLLVTHLHSDHTLGLPDLMYSPWTLEREKPLEIWGPKGIKAMAGYIQKAYSEDLSIRLDGAEPANTTGWQTVVTEVSGGVIYQDAALTVEAIPVCHGDWKQAYGYKFIHEGQSIVVSGDTTYCPALEAAAKGADILVHEVYDAEALAIRSADWRAYHEAAHTSGSDLGKLAHAGGVKKLVLYHQLAWGGSQSAILEQVRHTYKGPLTWGEDLMVFRLTGPKQD